MKRTLIIAEAGVNHNGNIENAFRLVDAAHEAGADYVKFQTFKADKLVSKAARQADYQAKNIGGEKQSQYDMLKKLELSPADHDKLIDYCKQKNIHFLSTGFDLDSLDYLASIGIKLAKVPSGEITNLPYLEKTASLFKEIILSTGMSTLPEIKAAIEVFLSHGITKEKITVLHCNTEYPTPMQDVNLNAMLHIGRELGVAIGYSDHTLGIEVPIAAVAMGATIIEKHFTLDKELPGPDHKASLDPVELIAMVKAIRNIESALSGSGFKAPSESEMKNMAVVRKSIHLTTALQKGTVIKAEDLTMLRPGDGISPFEMYKVIGMKLNRDVSELHKLAWADLS